MILTDLQRYVRDGERVSMAQLTRRFASEPDALRGMLDRLAAKGRVRRVASPPLCTGCRICPADALELYEWAEAPAGPPQPDRCPRCG